MKYYTVCEELNKLGEEVIKAVVGLDAQFPHSWALTLAHPAVHPQDASMLQRDEPKPAAHAQAAEDPLASLYAAIDELVEFAGEDGIRAGRFDPTTQGPNYPDVCGLDSHIEAVLQEVHKLLVAPTSPVQKINIADEPNGLLVEHKPGARVTL